MADTAVPGQSSEVLQLQAAAHPNPAVLTVIERTLNYDEGKGPNFDVRRDGLRKKYGHESGNDFEMINSAMKSVRMRWYFDERGQPLRGNLAGSLKGCTSHEGTPPGLCATVTIVEADLQAGGSGIVRTLRVRLGNNPLLKSARFATDAYLREVDENRARRQRDESTQGGTPKL
jgi:hypothetical protein